MFESTFDYKLIMGATVITTTGLIMISRAPLSSSSVKSSRSLILCGILLLSLIVVNFISIYKYDLHTIIVFLSLQVIESNHRSAYIRYGIALSYVAILLGGFQWLRSHKKDRDRSISGSATEYTTPNSDIIKENKVFINAKFNSLIVQIVWLFAIFILVPTGLVEALIGVVLNKSHIPLSVKVIIISVIVVALLCILSLFFWMRKYWILTVGTTIEGITSVGVLKKIHSRWNEIISIDVIEKGVVFKSKMIEVKSKQGTFYFPLTMKEKNDANYKLDRMSNSWIDADGAKKPLSPNNCPLYQEIRKKTNSN